jgi:hypothetical protein
MWKSSPRARKAAAAAAAAEADDAQGLVEQSGGSGSSAASLAFAPFESAQSAGPPPAQGVADGHVTVCVGTKVRWVGRAGRGSVAEIVVACAPIAHACIKRSASTPRRGPSRPTNAPAPAPNLRGGVEASPIGEHIVGGVAGLAGTRRCLCGCAGGPRGREFEGGARFAAAFLLPRPRRPRPRHRPHRPRLHGRTMGRLLGKRRPRLAGRKAGRAPDLFVLRLEARPPASRGARPAQALLSTLSRLASHTPPMTHAPRPTTLSQTPSKHTAPAHRGRHDPHQAARGGRPGQRLVGVRPDGRGRGRRGGAGGRGLAATPARSHPLVFF